MSLARASNTYSYPRRMNLLIAVFVFACIAEKPKIIKHNNTIMPTVLSCRCLLQILQRKDKHKQEANIDFSFHFPVLTFKCHSG